ncbi:unnamed protein product [Rodentolepis nana]|uniref:GOLD domain-containing protein n=1 Tax=Rodentolepis nana TaxID=102285 RepID=A0A0R3T3W2_RODNA|nr:unnamed protein product [Rodentolepis nana]
MSGFVIFIIRPLTLTSASPKGGELDTKSGGSSPFPPVGYILGFPSLSLELDTESGVHFLLAGHRIRWVFSVPSLSLELDTESGGSSPFPPLDTESGGSSPFPPLNTESGLDIESGGSSPFPPLVNTESGGSSPFPPVCESDGSSPFPPVGFTEGMWVECARHRIRESDGSSPFPPVGFTSGGSSPFPPGRTVNSSSGQSTSVFNTSGSNSSRVNAELTSTTSTAPTPSRPANGPTKASPKRPPANSQLSTNMDAKVTNELMHLRSVIQEKERRLDELYSEIDKLSSVLQQHITECDTWKKVNLGFQNHLINIVQWNSTSSTSITPEHIFFNNFGKRMSNNIEFVLTIQSAFRFLSQSHASYMTFFQFIT